MQDDMFDGVEAVKKKSKAGLIFVIVLIVLLGGGAGFYFGVLGNKPQDLAAMVPFFQNTQATAVGDYKIPLSAVLTGEGGNNIVGNRAENLAIGGLVAGQGDYLFFSNLEQQGQLYLSNKDGSGVLQLSDFAVANISIVGDKLVFTDLKDTYITFTTPLGQSRLEKIDPSWSHKEIWEKTDSSEDFSKVEYGGNLYIMSGLTAAAGGDNTALNIQKIDGNFHNPVITKNAIFATSDTKSVKQMGSQSGGLLEIEKLSLGSKIAVIPMTAQSSSPQEVAKPDETSASLLEDWQNFNYVKVDSVDGKSYTIDILDPNEKVVNSIIKKNIAYLEVSGGGKERIIRFDTETFTVIDAIKGRCVVSVGESVLFIAPNKMIYQIPDGTSQLIQASVVGVSHIQAQDNGDVLFLIDGSSDTGILSKNGSYPKSGWKMVSQLGEWYNYLIKQEEKVPTYIVRKSPPRTYYLNKTSFFPPTQVQQGPVGPQGLESGEQPPLTLICGWKPADITNIITITAVNIENSQGKETSKPD